MDTKKPVDEIANGIWDNTNPMVTSCMDKKSYLIGAMEAVKYMRNHPETPEQIAHSQVQGDERKEYNHQLTKKLGTFTGYQYDGKRCVAGCKRFEGYETKHHPDCPFYPNSLSEKYDKIEAASPPSGQEAIELKEKERREWADMCIKKQATIEEMKEREEFLVESYAAYKSDYDALDNCISEILKLTKDKKIIELVEETRFHLCVNMK